VERQFWERIATGITSERAAKAVGVSQPVGTRWFRHRGGMPLFMSKPVSAEYLPPRSEKKSRFYRRKALECRFLALTEPLASSMA
jgi:hypothetical protein